MRIVAVTRAFNEEDIIEPLIRHHAALVDHHIVLDNASVDRTMEILVALKHEGAQLTILQNDSVIFSETQFNTYLYKMCVETHQADWVVFLDADEFIDARGIGDLRSFLADVPSDQATVSVELINYHAPTEATQSELNVVKRLCRRSPRPIDVWKVFVRGGIDPGRISVDAGNHHIALDGVQQPLEKQDRFLLAHFPSRSPLHWAGKAVTGRLRVLAAGQSELSKNRAFHYVEMFETLKRTPKDWVGAALAVTEDLKTTPDLVDDPIAYLGGALIYTQPVDYGWRTLSLLLSTAERMAARYGALLDEYAVVRERVDADIGSIRMLYGPVPIEAPPAGYGAIVTQAWKSAADPGFAAIMGAGWSKREKWGGFWGLGATHELRLFYHAAPPTDAEVEADVVVPLVGTRERQDVDVVVAGTQLATWTFTRDNNRGMRTVRIPGALIAASLPVMTLEFRPRSVAAPADLDPANKDRRLIGMGIRGLRQRIM